MAQRVAVDTGGTFTDFVWLDEDTGDLRSAKLPSTPDDPSRAILAGLRALVGSVSYFCHGTTVGTNALLEEQGVRTALLVTEGFRGIAEVMEQARPYGSALFDIDYAKPALLVPPSRTAEVPERIDANGAVLRPLDQEGTRAALRALARERPQSLAVCLLFSFLHPAHEQRVRDLAAEELPDCSVSLSSDVLPQIREYYRLSTTVINAYLAPLLASYLGQLERRLAELGMTTAQRYVMQSNGGTSTFAHSAQRAVGTILSGPAGGVTAGAALGQTTGRDDLITFDMGGTSCDVALIREGVPSLANGGVIDGRHIALPMMDINTVSAGGGTIARVDEQGALEVGPRSAGAVPGPACYGHGGELPTVTDANLVLGYLADRAELGGSLRLRRDLALEAVARHVADPLGLDPLEAAEGIVAIINTKMEEAIKAISTMRGFDLRGFALVAFGGAGPLHAGAMARELRMPEVVIPLQAGVFSSIGLLMADVRHDYVRSRLTALVDLDPAAADELTSSLRDDAVKDLRDEGFGDADIVIEFALDLRYEGQGYELTVPCTPPLAVEGGLQGVREGFDALHATRFGHAAPDSPVEVVSYRVTGIGRTPRVELPRTRPSGTPLERALVGRRPLRFDRKTHDGRVFRRDLLDVGHRVEGPAVVEQADATVLLPPGQTAVVDEWRNLVVAVERA